MHDCVVCGRAPAEARPEVEPGATGDAPKRDERPQHPSHDWRVDATRHGVPDEGTIMERLNRAVLGWANYFCLAKAVWHKR